MSHYIPVFFFPIEKSELPAEVAGWNSVLPLLEARLAKGAEADLRASTSRNWWHQEALGLICTDLAIPGLDFIQAEVVCLERDALQAAKRSLGSVLNQVQESIPNLSLTSEATGNIWWLRHYMDGDVTKEFLADTLRKAFNEAQARTEIKGLHDIGYQSIVDFYSFIKTLHKAVDECLGQNKCLLYVQIQP